MDYNYLVWSDGTFVLEDEAQEYDFMGDDFTIIKSNEDRIEMDVDRFINTPCLFWFEQMEENVPSSL